jgi:hypothetical protein
VRRYAEEIGREGDLVGVIVRYRRDDGVEGKSESETAVRVHS